MPGSVTELKSPHYKVVCVWLVSKVTTGNFNYQFEIYSSKTASWKLSGEVFTRPNLYYFGSGVFWNGSLHWIESSSYFDVNQELRMEMPIYDKEHERKPKYFVECKGHLYLIVSHLSSRTSFEILEMETDYTGWNMRYLVSLQELIIAYPRFQSYDFDVLLVKEVEEESLNLVLRVGDIVFSYDLRDMSMSFKEIQKIAPAEKRYNKIACQYIQTLACV